jgi:hypothetical protein
MVGLYFSASILAGRASAPYVLPHLELPSCPSLGQSIPKNTNIHKTTTFKEAEHCILTDHVRYTASLSMKGERIYS